MASPRLKIIFALDIIVGTDFKSVPKKPIRINIISSGNAKNLSFAAYEPFFAGYAIIL